MDTETQTYELEVEPGRIVKFRELTAYEFENLFKAHAASPWELTQMGVRRSLVADRGEPIEYKDVAGPALSQRFSSPRALLTLRQAWERVHLPGEEDAARVKAMRAVAG